MCANFGATMRAYFAGIAGVLGDHDLLGEAAGPYSPPGDCLDGRVVEIGGLRSGVVSGIDGSPDRTKRRGPHGVCGGVPQCPDR